MAILEWLKTNWVELAAAYVALVTLARIIVKLTPTTADDTWLKKATDFIESIIILRKTK